jgi:hypothetical protein
MLFLLLFFLHLLLLLVLLLLLLVLLLLFFLRLSRVWRVVGWRKRGQTLCYQRNLHRHRLLCTHSMTAPAPSVMSTAQASRATPPPVASDAMTVVAVAADVVAVVVDVCACGARRSSGCVGCGWSRWRDFPWLSSFWGCHGHHHAAFLLTTSVVITALTIIAAIIVTTVAITIVVVVAAVIVPAAP